MNSLKTSGQLSASSYRPFASPRRPDRLDAGVYQRDSPRRFDACRTVSGRHSHPRLDRADTKLSYCNGEIGAGSSNITPYMVWACKRPRWVAHTLQQMDGFSVEREQEVGESREQDKASASGSVSAMATLRQLRLLEGSSCWDSHSRRQSATVVINGLGPVDDSDR